MTPRQRIVLGLAAIGAVTLLALGARDPVRRVELVAAVRAPLVVSFQEEGKTRLRDRYRIASPVAGWLRRIELEPGDPVHRGLVVADVEPAAAALLDPGSRARAESEVDAARHGLQAAKERVTATAAAENLARRELERLEGMAGSGAVSEAQFDAARTARRRARAEVEAARAEQRVAEDRLAAAQALLAQQGKSGGDALPLSSPIDGVVVLRHRESAGPVAAAEPLLELGDPAALEIEVEALSTDAVKLTPGMAARVLRWGGPGALTARVTRVEPGGYTKISALGVEEQRVRVILAFEDARERWATLGDGYRVDMEFILQQADDVLQLPSSALFRHDGGWAVFRDDDGVARRTPVEIGARAGLVTEIRAGIAAGTRVVAFPDDQIDEGTRIRDAAR